MLTALALIAFVAGVDTVGYDLTALALGVTELNATTELCLGCEAYQLIRRPQPA